MQYLKYAALFGVLSLAMLFVAGTANAQVRVGVGVGIGPEPVCAYGYYNYYPYACAPYGFWGPSYFLNGVFIGVGPWYHSHWYGPGYRAGWGYRPGFGYRPGYGHYAAPVHGHVGGGYRAPGGGFHGGAAYHGGGFHGGGSFHGGGGHGGHR